VHGHTFQFFGVNGARNTTIEGRWTSDGHVRGAIRQTGRDEVTWEATVGGR
jgi:hypothetical protein